MWMLACTVVRHMIKSFICSAVWGNGGWTSEDIQYLFTPRRDETKKSIFLLFVNMIDYIQEVLGDKCKGWSACVTLEQSDAAPWGQISWSGEWLPSMWAHPVDQMEKYFWSLLTNTLIRFKKYCWRNIKGDRTVWHLGWWGDQQNTTFLCAEIWRYFDVIVHIFFSMNSKRYPVLTNVGNSVGRGK